MIVTASRVPEPVADSFWSTTVLTHADIALARLDEIGAGHPDRDFYAGKLSAGRFFAATVLPRLAVERTIAEETTLDLMELPEGAF